jgi:thiosulfate/3-mercaptopyruvate sulfurtransferase
MAPDPTVSTVLTVADLASILGEKRTVVLDCSYYLAAANRDARAEYRAEHIPGAVYFDIDALSDSGTSLPHMLLPPDQFAAAMGRLGVGDGDRIVVYDTSGTNFSAARAWWMFRIYGHDDVAVLDGGLAAWKRAGRALESGEVRRPPATFTPRYRRELVRTLDDVRHALGDGTAQVVDARSAGRFAGTEPEPRAGLRGGHMPGSRNLPYASFTGPDGLLLDRAGLEARFREAGVDLSRPVIASCGSGVTACTVLLALDLLGHENHALYDGSWTEWGGRPDTEVSS